MFSREPTLIIEFVRALLAAVVLFGLKLSAEQTVAIVLVVSAGLALWNRQAVTPNAKVAPSAPRTP